MENKAIHPLTKRCIEKLHDPQWDEYLAKRVGSAQRKKKQVRLALAAIAAVAVSTVLSFTVVAWHDAQEQNSLTAMLEEAAYTVSWSSLSD